MNGLEAVADAIQQFEGWKPGTRSYKNRNPGNLRLPLQEWPDDSNGYSIFPTFVDGYTALLTDLQDKFIAGRNEHGLGQASTLLALMEVYAPPTDNNPTETYADFVAAWASRALGKPITIQSPLSSIWTPA